MVIKILVNLALLMAYIVQYTKSYDFLYLANLDKIIKCFQLKLHRKKSQEYPNYSTTHGLSLVTQLHKNY